MTFHSSKYVAMFIAMERIYNIGHILRASVAQWLSASPDKTIIYTRPGSQFIYH